MRSASTSGTPFFCRNARMDFSEGGFAGGLLAVRSAAVMLNKRPLLSPTLPSDADMLARVWLEETCKSLRAASTEPSMSSSSFFWTFRSCFFDSFSATRISRRFRSFHFRVSALLTSSLCGSLSPLPSSPDSSPSSCDTCTRWLLRASSAACRACLHTRRTLSSSSGSTLRAPSNRLHPTRCPCSYSTNATGSLSESSCRKCTSTPYPCRFPSHHVPS
mmetsp:Transcript_32201/g.75878  ORF Transcript_32201/g.75878 Transcript_32201/m.75878 type:complete len:218 (+) Transcript_32201:1204-1857(+)